MKERHGKKIFINICRTEGTVRYICPMPELRARKPPKKLHQAIKSLAEKNGRTISSQIIFMLQENIFLMIAKEKEQ